MSKYHLVENHILRLICAIGSIWSMFGAFYGQMFFRFMLIGMHLDDNTSIFYCKV